MAYSEWAYADPQTVPAQLVSRDDRAIDQMVEGSHSRSIYAGSTAGDLNQMNVYPVVRVGSAPDQYYTRDEAGDVSSFMPNDGGQAYKITEAWAEMVYADAKQVARNELERYYQAYSTSQFVAGGDTFGASASQTLSYVIIDTIVAKAEAAGGYVPNSQIVFDLLADAHPVASAAAWGAFWGKYEELFDEARSIVGTAWQDIKAATTTDEVRIIIAALPAIPGA